MAKTLRVKNSLDTISPFSAIASKSAAAGTAIVVKNYNNAVASWAVQLGKTGEEQSEILVLGTAAPGGTLNTTAALRYDHPADTPIYFIKYDKIIFKVSTTGTAGTAVAITDGTVTITPDNLYKGISVTQFEHSTGQDAYAYKAAFYNSVLDVSTDDSDWITPSGYSFYSLAKLRERAKLKLKSAKYLQDDAQVDDWINEWMETMNNAAVKVNQDYSLGTVAVAHGTDGLGTITSSDFKEIRKIEFTTDGSNWYTGTKMFVTDFKDTSSYNSAHPYFYMLGDNVFGKKPDSEAGTARITYYKLQTPMVNDTDELPVSMRGYTKSFVNYPLAQAYYLDGKEKMGDRFTAYANDDLSKFTSEITPRSKTGVQYMEITDVISGEDDFDILQL